MKRMEGGATKICGAPKLHSGPNLKLRAGKDFLLVHQAISLGPRPLVYFGVGRRVKNQWHEIYEGSGVLRSTGCRGRSRAIIRS